ncbi:MAG TPA: heme o synthase [Burkholderiales bacterium]|nr:heme o synthase [Burkholderiales bacterium]
MGAAIKLALNLFKLRIGIVIAATAVAGMAVQPGRALPVWQEFVLALSVLVCSAAAGAFNQYYEYEFDRRMERTRNRPFVTGVLKRTPQWLGLIALMTMGGVAAAWLAVNPFAALYTFLGAFVYAIVYTVWLKRRTWLNIVVGGLAGSFAVLAGAAAVTPALSVEALLLALVLFLWTPPHFWSLAIAYRHDYVAAGIPMLPVVKGDATAARMIFYHTVALVSVSLLPMFYSAGWIYFAGAAGGGAWFLRDSLRLAREPSRRNALHCFHASLAQLSILLLATMIESAWRL